MTIMRPKAYTLFDGHLADSFDQESFTAYAAHVDRIRLRASMVAALLLVVATASCGRSEDTPRDPADDSPTLTSVSFVRLCGAVADRIAETAASLPEIRDRAPIAARLAADAADLDQASEESIQGLERLHPADGDAIDAKEGALQIYARCRELASLSRELATEATALDDATLNDRTAEVAHQAEVLSQDITDFAGGFQRPGQ